MDSDIHVFWDNSNIFIPAKYVANQREGIFAEREIRIHFDNLYRLATANRNVGSGICVGSVPPDLQSVWERLRATGIGVELFERGQETRKEQGVDQCLQVHMLRLLADVRKPGTAVLLTGDGAGYFGGIGYHADLERLQNAGWGIEVISWDVACNKRLKAWAQEVGVYIPLEDYYDSVTYLEGTRRQRNVSLTHRRFATPTAKTDATT